MADVESTYEKSLYDVIIAGGGLAGLISAIALSGKGFKILLLEKKNYPFNKVCGEYVSNEVLSYLKSLGFDPFSSNASKIDKLRISNPAGNFFYINLDMGGFGISRYRMDHMLSLKAIKSGVELKENCRVNNIEFENNLFNVNSSCGIYNSPFVIGSYGKRDILDKKLMRGFIQRHTGFMGVKYHIKMDYPINEIGLDNFPGGYCGIVKIEDDKYNLCYLYKRKRSDNFKSIRELEEKILFSNPVIRNIFEKAQFISETPDVINEISFENKTCIENHIYLCGDAAGLITPLCGNGMAMAIHGSKILTDILINNIRPGENIDVHKRKNLENLYKKKWNQTFASRLFWGRKLQKVSGNAALTTAFLNVIHSMPSVEKWIINKTHGDEIVNL